MTRLDIGMMGLFALIASVTLYFGTGYVMLGALGLILGAVCGIIPSMILRMYMHHNMMD